MRRNGSRKFGVLLSVGLSLLWSSIGLSLTLKEVQNALSRSDATWKAKETNKFEELAVYEKTSPFGLAQEPVEIIRLDDESSLGTTAEIPPYLDWRNVNGKNFLSPITNQGRCGSCVAFAAAAVFEGQLNITYGNPNLNLDLSEQYLFANIGGCDTGSWPSQANSFLKSTGTPDEACQPYVSGRLGEDQAASFVCGNYAERVYKITKAQSLAGESSIKTALQNGPVLTTMTVYEDLAFYAGGIYEHVTGEVLGGHAVTIVGYDDANDAWIVKNSWGVDWGEAGYFRIKRSDESGVGQDGYLYSVNIPQKMIRLNEPVFMGAVTGNAQFKIANLATQNFTEATYDIVNVKDATQKISGVLKNGELVANVNTTGVKDGVYEIKVAGKFQDNSATFKPWFSRAIIKNKPANISIKLEPDFDATQVQKDRVYFTLKTTYTDVPLTHATLYIKKKDGSYEKTVAMLDPGPASKVGWRTGASPNGEYNVYVIGNVGNLQSFESAHLNVTIKN